MREETDNHSIKMQHPVKTVNMSHYEPRENEEQITTTKNSTHTHTHTPMTTWRVTKEEKSPLSSKTRYKMQLNFHKQFHIEIVKMSCTVVVLMLMLLLSSHISNKHTLFRKFSTRWGIRDFFWFDTHRGINMWTWNCVTHFILFTNFNDVYLLHWCFFLIFTVISKWFNCVLKLWFY